MISKLVQLLLFVQLNPELTRPEIIKQSGLPGVAKSYLDSYYGYVYGNHVGGFPTDNPAGKLPQYFVRGFRTNPKTGCAKTTWTVTKLGIEKILSCKELSDSLGYDI